MSEKRRELYARFGLQLLHNRRAFKAERVALGSMGLYTFCVIYARAEMTDGFIPEVQVRLMYPFKSKPSELAAKLVAVGLWERQEGGYSGHDGGQAV